jgi:hypothetical protein
MSAAAAARNIRITIRRSSTHGKGAQVDQQPLAITCSVRSLDQEARMFGVNLAGAEFGSVPGTYGVDYTYPTSSELDYYAAKGVTLIRLPFLWERMQPALYAAAATTS